MSLISLGFLSRKKLQHNDQGQRENWSMKNLRSKVLRHCLFRKNMIFLLWRLPMGWVGNMTYYYVDLSGHLGLSVWLIVTWQHIFQFSCGQIQCARKLLYPVVTQRIRFETYHITDSLKRQWAVTMCITFWYVFSCPQVTTRRKTGKICS